VAEPVPDYAGRVGRVGVLMLVLSVAVVTAAVASAAQSPRALRASILGAAKAQHSVHYVTREVDGNALLKISADVAADDGRQHVSFKAGKQTGQITILVLDDTTYVTGDTSGLELLQGLTASQASKYAGQWISIPKGDKSYSRTAAAVTLGSFLQEITPHGRLAAFKGKLHGTRVIGVRGTSGTKTKKRLQALVARARGKPLPLEEDEFAPAREYISHTGMTKWNESVQVQAPSSSTPISTVRGG
jgi:hypothetical protein